jgi:hypothetical protein
MVDDTHSSGRQGRGSSEKKGWERAAEAVIRLEGSNSNSRDKRSKPTSLNAVLIYTSSKITDSSHYSQFTLPSFLLEC